MRKQYWAILALVFLPQLLSAQTTESPYAGERHREIKALSSEEVAMYMRGAGMGLARAAELNQYPGPMHVLELEVELTLSQEQRKQTVKLFNEVKAEARRLGKEIVELERELDLRFSSAQISNAELRRLVKDIGSKKADLRIAHLNAHLKQRSILSAEQIVQYDSLRGYSGNEHHGINDGER